MITRINGVTVPKSDPVHGLAGAAMEARINEFVREVEDSRRAYVRDRERYLAGTAAAAPPEYGLLWQQDPNPMLNSNMVRNGGLLNDVVGSMLGNRLK